MQRIDNILGKVRLPKGAPAADLKRLGKLAKLQSHWAEVVGAKLAGHSRIASVDKGRLKVVCDSSVWHAELRMVAKPTCAALAKKTGIKIRELNAVVRPLAMKPAQPSRPAATARTRPVIATERLLAKSETLPEKLQPIFQRIVRLLGQQEVD